jgi:multiple sugar transport system ATP-binding protein
MAKVLLKNVTKIFDKKVWAVKDLNVEIADREFVVLVGPSGCGKSTTLRMIAGLEEVSEGEIYIGERLVNDVPPKDRDIAMVFQNYALYPHMTVRQNMAFGLKLRKYSKQEITERVKEAADILGIGDLLDRKPKALSGGQRQRVAVGRAIVRKPQVFLFDEPLSNLDAKLRVQMRTEISKLHSRLGTTMIYVTHDQMEAMTMGDRIVIQKDGVVHQVDSPLNLYDKPVNKFVAGFIGSPAMNFMNGKLVDGKDLYFDEGNFKVKITADMASALKPYENKEVTFGLRPEDIYEKGLSEGAREKAPVQATLEVLEPMGNELFLYLNTGSNAIVARVDVHEAPKVGRKVDLIFDMSKAHFFDAETEKAIA